MRSLKREADVRAMVTAGGIVDTTRLSFVAADLLSDVNWSTAVAGCDYVMHVASPFPATMPANEDDLIVPAREGTLRVLRAARDAGVKRVVLTSSFVAVGYGQTYRTEPYTEADWTNVDGDVAAYGKSKTLAERAAWDFIAREGGALELAVVNPVGIFGPALGKDLSTSIEIVKRMMDGALPGLPNLAFGIVDVRDLADLHLRAMVDPAASGERFLAVPTVYTRSKQSGACCGSAWVLLQRVCQPARCRAGCCESSDCSTDRLNSSCRTLDTPDMSATPKRGACSVGRHAPPIKLSSIPPKAWYSWAYCVMLHARRDM